MTTEVWEEVGDVLHLPEEAGQGAPRHRLAPGVTAATCRYCARYVVRWSTMGEHERFMFTRGLRAAMTVARRRGPGPFTAVTRIS